MLELGGMHQAKITHEFEILHNGTNPLKDGTLLARKDRMYLINNNLIYTFTIHEVFNLLYG